MFSDLLEPELGRESHSRIWSIVGGGGGLALGFVVGNVPGALAGAFAGNRLGAIRDAKGKSVGEVFLGLGTDRKAQVSFGSRFRRVPRRLDVLSLNASTDFVLSSFCCFSTQPDPPSSRSQGLQHRGTAHLVL